MLRNIQRQNPSADPAIAIARRTTTTVACLKALALALLALVPVLEAQACSCFYSREAMLDSARYVFLARAGAIRKATRETAEPHAENAATFEVVESFLGDPLHVSELRQRYRTDNVVTSCSNPRLMEGEVYLVLSHRPGPAYIGQCTAARAWNGSEEALSALRTRARRADRLDPRALEDMRRRLSDFLAAMPGWPDRNPYRFSREVIMEARAVVRDQLRAEEEEDEGPNALDRLREDLLATQADPSRWSHPHRHVHQLQQILRLLDALELGVGRRANNEVFLWMPLPDPID